MKYKMEELVPVVAKLAEEYTGGESTSITYERAQQLMGAVVYCIGEAERDRALSLVEQGGRSVKEAYYLGLECVERKTREALALYNELMIHFCSYENECLNDTVVKGLPEFFKWYDCRYEPQNTILTLDYPILADNPERLGIDRIHDYVLCIQLEQRFLNRFSQKYIMEVLSGYNKDYRSMIDNLCEVVLGNLIGHMLAGKDLSASDLNQEEYERLQEMIRQEELGALREKLKKVINEMVEKYYDGDKQLAQYLGYAVDNISVGMKTAADNGNLVGYWG